MKRKSFFNKKIIPIMLAYSTLGLFSHSSFAQQGPTQGTPPPLMVPQYSASQLQQVGCDTGVWNQLVQTYINERQAERAIAKQIQVADQTVAAPPAPGQKVGNMVSGTSCVQGALGQFNQISGILKTLTTGIGSFDINGIANTAKNQLMNQACSQINSYTSSLVSGVTNRVLQPINQANGAINQINTNPVGTVTNGIR